MRCLTTRCSCSSTLPGRSGELTASRIGIAATSFLRSPRCPSVESVLWLIVPGRTDLFYSLIVIARRRSRQGASILESTTIDLRLMDSRLASLQCPEVASGAEDARWLQYNSD